ncbi:conserved hypothetical protein [Streptomyces pristinaespiralis ATCC 25486]|uniref:Uncharacterized protein n=1 Tax=Streptomyces pristinaespiralis (strain ATCC 25486 / DSM 40338 / CBS 914.69 / JCM 4507 / KCC S-0507 / NBRC 13074 / NRRL 2958 / 5647) TaxID=457429 RepID=B5HG98_STRE2|nr:conserved hypothetical protein [Streptomyces pristinaespiralis ATCC 25486]
MVSSPAFRRCCGQGCGVVRVRGIRVSSDDIRPELGKKRQSLTWTGQLHYAGAGPRYADDGKSGQEAHIFRHLAGRVTLCAPHAPAPCVRSRLLPVPRGHPPS